jgi:hypothetical protein
MSYKLDKNTTIYHGSVRLNAIQCYINSNLNYLFRYLEDLNILRNLNIYKNNNLIINVLNDYQIIIPTDFNSNPMTKEIVLFFLLKYMYDNNTPFLISKTLQYYYKNYDKRVYTKLYNELLEFILYIENNTYTDILNEINVKFYSVMRINLQFFSIKEIALLYAKNDINQLYEYTTFTEGYLLNISDYIYLQNNLIFNSFTEYSTDTIKYYTEKNKESLINNILYDVIIIPYKELYYNFQDKLHIFNTSNNEFKKWNLLKRLNTSFDDPEINSKIIQWAHTNNYKSIISKIISDLYINQHHIYDFLIQKYKSDTILLESVILKFPDFNFSESFEEFFNLYYYEEFDILFENHISESINFITQIIKLLQKYFRFKNNTNILNIFVDRLQKHDNLIDIYTEINLSSEWLTYFQFPLISPKGLWIISNLYRFVNPSVERYSNYSVDTLLCYSLQYDKFFTDKKFIGWYCENPKEYMIYNPEKYGIMQKLTKNYNLDNCDYSLENYQSLE